MSWKVKVSKRVLKEIKRVSKKDAKRLLLVLDEFSKDPYQGDISKIKGEDNVWRRRTGNYRILYEVVLKKKHIYIFQICRRTSISYRKKK